MDDVLSQISSRLGFAAKLDFGKFYQFRANVDNVVVCHIEI